MSGFAERELGLTPAQGRLLYADHATVMREHEAMRAVLADLGSIVADVLHDHGHLNPEAIGDHVLLAARDSYREALEASPWA